MQGSRSAEAPDCVGSHMRAVWRWLARMRGLTNRAVVEEACCATEGESIVSGLFPKKFEEVDRLAMGVCFWMVFIGNPRSETNMGEGDRIILRSKSS